VILLLNIGGFDKFGELEKLSLPIATAVVLAIGGYFLKPRKKPSNNDKLEYDNLELLSVQNNNQ